MVLIKYDIAQKKYYTIEGSKRKYLTKTEVKERIHRRAKWETIENKTIRTLEKGTNRILSKVGYVLATWVFNLDKGNFKCGSCKRAEFLRLIPRPSAMFVQCMLCGVTMMLARHEHKEHLSDSELPRATYIESYSQKEVDFKTACEFWAYYKGSDGSGIAPPTADMMRALGFMP